MPKRATLLCQPVLLPTGVTRCRPAQLANLPTCPVHHARTHPTAACAHHARQCQSAPPPRLRRRPRPVTLRRPPLPAVMLSTVVSALSASFRPLRVPSSLCLFPPAAVTQCIWSAWRSTARKPMVRRTCCARCVATADARSVYREGGPVCTTISCDRYVVVKACPCRSGSRAKPLCGKPSKTTNSGRLPPAMHPNPARRQGLPCCAATGSRPWDARRSRLRTAAAPRDAVGARAYPTRHWHSRVAPWLALPRLCHGGPPGCRPSARKRRRAVQPLRWRITLGA